MRYQLECTSTPGRHVLKHNIKQLIKIEKSLFHPNFSLFGHMLFSTTQLVFHIQKMNKIAGSNLHEK